MDLIDPEALALRRLEEAESLAAAPSPEAVQAVGRVKAGLHLAKEGAKRAMRLPPPDHSHQEVYGYGQYSGL